MPRRQLNHRAPRSINVGLDRGAPLLDGIRLLGLRWVAQKGEVLNEEVLRTYVDYRRSKEVDAIRLRPHPYEFALYYDI